MPTPAHLHPERNMEPDDVVEDLKCPECGREMEPIGGGEWECQWPFCDSNNREPEQTYENLVDILDSERRAHNGLKRLNLGLLKCIKHECIYGSAAFNSMVADVEILTSKIPQVGIDWMRYYLTEIRVQIMKWKEEAERDSTVAHVENPNGIAEGIYATRAKTCEHVLDLIDGKKPEKK